MARRDDWETPQKLFDYLDSVFDFTLDAAASKENAKCDKYYDERADGLTKPWDRSTFCNPPYSKDREFAVKADIEWRTVANCSCLVLPVRSDRLWFQRLLHVGNVKTCWITGRLHFGGSDKAAFMYSILFYWHPEQVLPLYMQAGQFNDSGKGDART